MSDIHAYQKERLEELRMALRAENISYGELAELQSLVEFIEPGDVELLEPAGVPEFPTTEYAIDIPNYYDPSGPWCNINYYDSREEAIAAAKDLFGADDEGRITVISQIPREDD